VIACAVLLGAAACSSSAEIAGPAPFDQVLIDLFGTDDTDRYLTETDVRVSGLVADCMNEAGFEFVREPEPVPYIPPADGDRAAAEVDGFGIIAGFNHQLAQPLSPYAFEDPNVPYLRTLSSAEIGRFFETLEGAEPEPGQVRQSGCRTTATEAGYADWNRFFDVLPNFTALGEERDSHPDWLGARSDWQACMVERGYDYFEPDDVRGDVQRRMRELVNEAYPNGEVPFTVVDGVTTPDAGVDVLLDDLLEFERSAAIANIDCTEPVAEVFDRVEREVQQAFVDRHQATIDELLAATQ
jgi:hypothetical protein